MAPRIEHLNVSKYSLESLGGALDSFIVRAVDPDRCIRFGHARHRMERHLECTLVLAQADACGIVWTSLRPCGCRTEWACEATPLHRRPTHRLKTATQDPRLIIDDQDPTPRRDVFSKTSRHLLTRIKGMGNEGHGGQGEGFRLGSSVRTRRS